MQSGQHRSTEFFTSGSSSKTNPNTITVKHWPDTRYLAPSPHSQRGTWCPGDMSFKGDSVDFRCVQYSATLTGSTAHSGMSSCLDSQPISSWGRMIGSDLVHHNRKMTQAIALQHIFPSGWIGSPRYFRNTCSCSSSIGTSMCWIGTLACAKYIYWNNIIAILLGGKIEIPQRTKSPNTEFRNPLPRINPVQLSENVPLDVLRMLPTSPSRL